MNTIMQVCFFAISKVLPREEAIEAIRKSIRDTYGKKGEEVVQKNLRAVDETLAHLFEVSFLTRQPAELRCRRPSLQRLPSMSAMCWARSMPATATKFP